MDQMQHSEGRSDVHWFAPIVADAEAGFGGNLNAYEVRAEERCPFRCIYYSSHT
jgi:isocitrate lyase